MTERRQRVIIKIYECKDCQTQCETQDSFRRHYKIHCDAKGKKLSQIDVQEKATIIMKCTLCVCDVMVDNVKKHSKFHSRQHRSKQPYRVCDLCGKSFTMKSTWWNHMRLHRARESGEHHCCTVCSKSFILSEHLSMHMAIHSNARPHVCEICGKAFKQSKGLYKHRNTHRTHTNFKPFPCEFCGKYFTNKYNLDGHMRTHTGEKPFQCDLCNAAFTHNVSLKTHKKSAHGIDMWKDQKTPVIKVKKSTEHTSLEQALEQALEPTVTIPSIFNAPYKHENPNYSLMPVVHQEHPFSTSQSIHDNMHVLAPVYGSGNGNPTIYIPDRSMLHRDPHLDVDGRSLTKL